MTNCDNYHVDGEFCKKCYTPEYACHPPLRKTTQPLCEHGMNPCCDVCHICRLEQSVSTLFENCIALRNEIAVIKTSLEILRSECAQAFLNKNEQPFKCPCCEGKGSIKKVVEPMVLEIKVCAACKGKGVLWK
jgi:hypothetical protein